MRLPALLLVASLLVVPTPSHAQGVLDLLARANAAEDSGKFRDAARAWRRLHDVAEGDPVPLYLAARSAVKAGDHAMAIDALREAIDDGLVTPWPIGADTTLRALHGHPRWAALVRQAGERAAARDTALRLELLALAAADQRGRAGIDSVMRTFGVPSPQADSAFARMAAIDTPVQARLREIIAARGWPGRRLVGDDAAHAAWLVVQHMDVVHQRALLPLLQAAVARGDARAADAALLDDRVRTDDGGSQRYGSQLRPPRPGQAPELFPIDRPECVDRRRAAVKLAPLATYLAQMGVAWRAPAKVCMEPAEPAEPATPATRQAPARQRRSTGRPASSTANTPA